MLNSDSKPLTKKEILAFVNDLEEKFPVYDWKYEGIDLWPIIRQIIFKHFLSKKITSKNNRRALSIKNLISFFIASSRLISSSKKVDFLFSASQAHRNILQEISYNRFADPIMDQLEEIGCTGLLLEQSKTNNYSGEIYKEERFRELDSALRWEEFKLKFERKLNRKNSVVLPKYTEFLSEVTATDQLIFKKITITRISNIAFRMRSNKKFATKLLQRINPRAIVLICYYGEWQQALMAAAKELGIKTFDIQHGIIYPEHYSYGAFSNIPQDGLSTLPDYFWTWSQYERNIVNSWSPQLAHKAIAWGNPWLMAFKENKVPNIQDISTLLEPNKKLILYTLGNRGKQFPDFLVSFIKENREDYQFWFRLHPRQLSELGSIKKDLEKLEILDQINIEEGTNQALPNILKHTNLHITLMSSVAIEAANMGVQTLILHEEGKEYYRDHEIKEYCYFYEKEVMGLKEAIITILKAGTVSVNNKLSLEQMSNKLIQVTDEATF